MWRRLAGTFTVTPVKPLQPLCARRLYRNCSPALSLKAHAFHTTPRRQVDVVAPVVSGFKAVHAFLGSPPLISSYFDVFKYAMSELKKARAESKPPAEAEGVPYTLLQPFDASKRYKGDPSPVFMRPEFVPDLEARLADEDQVAYVVYRGASGTGTSTALLNTVNGTFGVAYVSFRDVSTWEQIHERLGAAFGVKDTTRGVAIQGEVSRGCQQYFLKTEKKRRPILILEDVGRVENELRLHPDVREFMGWLGQRYQEGDFHVVMTASDPFVPDLLSRVSGNSSRLAHQFFPPVHDLYMSLNLLCAKIDKKQNAKLLDADWVSTGQALTGSDGQPLEMDATKVESLLHRRPKMDELTPWMFNTAEDIHKIIATCGSHMGDINSVIYATVNRKVNVDVALKEVVKAREDPISTYLQTANYRDRAVASCVFEALNNSKGEPVHPIKTVRRAKRFRSMDPADAHAAVSNAIGHNLLTKTQDGNIAWHSRAQLAAYTSVRNDSDVKAAVKFAENEVRKSLKGSNAVDK